MQTVGLGIIGTNFGAAVHLPAFRRVEGCEIVGITGSNLTRTQDIAAREGIRAFTTWQEMLADPSIHAISIATPPMPHREIVLAAAAAGKAVLCDKPFGMGVDDARAMCEAMEAAQKPHMVNFEFREHPGFRYLKQWMEEEQGGKLRHAELNWVVGSWGNATRPWSWQCDSERGGGILGALAVHSLDYLEWLFGPVTRLSARTRTAITERADANGVMHPIHTPDNCHMLLDMESGVTITCTVSNVAVHGTGHRLECHGDKQSIILDSKNLRDHGKEFHVFLADPGVLDLREVPLHNTPDEKEQDGRTTMMEPLVARFIEAVRTGNMNATPSFAAGLRTQVLIEAIQEANRTGSAVDIPRV